MQTITLMWIWDFPNVPCPDWNLGLNMLMNYNKIQNISDIGQRKLFGLRWMNPKEKVTFSNYSAANVHLRLLDFSKGRTAALGNYCSWKSWKRGGPTVAEECWTTGKGHELIQHKVMSTVTFKIIFKQSELPESHFFSISGSAAPTQMIHTLLF